MRLPDEAMPTLYLTRDEELAVEREASAVVMETAAAFEAFVAGGRAFPKHQWKQVKERASFRVYRSRRSFAAMDAAPPAYLSSAQGSVFSRTAKLSKAPKTTPSSSSETSGSGPGGGTASMHEFPVIVLTGIVPGTVEDAALGTLADTDALWRLRSSYLADEHCDCRILATIKRPSRDKPFRYLGIKWAWRRLPAFVQQRDMVYAERTGVMRDAAGRAVLGYNAMHSVVLPGIPELARFGLRRMRVSLCFLTRPHGDRAVEIYCRAFCAPEGEVPESFAVGVYADALLAAACVMDCAHLKKLTWLTQQRHRRRFSHPRVSAGGDDAAAPEDPGRCPGCQRALRRFGGLGRAAVVACWCCRRSVCAKCASERKLVVDVAPDGALTQRTLSFCIACIIEARSLPAFAIAREDVDKRHVGVETGSNSSSSDESNRMLGA